MSVSDQAIEADLAAGHAAVVQVVSTSEALMERRLDGIPPSEWHDLQVDITPREYVMDYLAHSFPTQLFEPYTDENGDLRSVPQLMRVAGRSYAVRPSGAAMI